MDLAVLKQCRNSFAINNYDLSFIAPNYLNTTIEPKLMNGTKYSE